MSSSMILDFNIPKDLLRAVLKNEHAKKVKTLLEAKRLEAKRLEEERKRILLLQRETELFQAKLLEEKEKTRIVEMTLEKYNHFQLSTIKRDLEEELELLEKECKRRKLKALYDQ